LGDVVTNATGVPAPATGLTRLEAGALLLGLALAAVLLWPLRGYLTDDTFIHLQYAQNLAEGRGPVFNPGERVYGSTSPLWVALLAVAMRTGVDGLLAARLIGAAATFGSIVLVLLLLRRTVETPALRAAGVVAWSAHAWMLRWAVSGMEAPLAVALTIAGFVTWVQEGGPRRPRATTGVLWGLAALTRPEAGLLLAAWGALLLWDARGRPGLAAAARAAGPAAVLCGTWLVFARLYYGTFWPQTLAAKTAGGAGAAYHLDNLWRQARIVGASDGILAVVLGIAVAAGAFGARGRNRSVRAVLPWIWVIGLPLLYAVRGVPVLSRYLLPILPVLAWLTWRAADRSWVAGRPGSVSPARVTLAATLLALLVVLQNLAVYRFQVLPHVRTFSPALQSSLVAWGRWIESHTAPEALVACPDIGAIGYYGRRRVVDLAGLVTPPMVPYLRTAEPESTIARFDFAEFSRPDYLVDRGPSGKRLMVDSPFAACLTPLAEASVPNLGVARRDPVVYTMYRVDWAVFDSLRSRR